MIEIYLNKSKTLLTLTYPLLGLGICLFVLRNLHTLCTYCISTIIIMACLLILFCYKKVLVYQNHGDFYHFWWLSYRVIFHYLQIRLPTEPHIDHLRLYFDDANNLNQLKTHFGIV